MSSPNVTCKDTALRTLLQAGRELYAAVDACDTAVAEKLNVHRSDLRCLNLLEMGPVSPGEIAKKLNLSSGSITALIDRLEKQKFVRRVRSSSDRRSVVVEIPPENYMRTAELYKQVAASVMERFGDMSAEEVGQAAQALRRFAQGCAAGAEKIGRKD